MEVFVNEVNQHERVELNDYIQSIVIPNEKQIIAFFL